MVRDFGGRGRGEFLVVYTAGKKIEKFRPRPEGILPDQVLRDRLSNDDPFLQVGRVARWLGQVRGALDNEKMKSGGKGWLEGDRSEFRFGRFSVSLFVLSQKAGSECQLDVDSNDRVGVGGVRAGFLTGG